MSHTPGPWHMEAVGPKHDVIIWTEGGVGCLATVHRGLTPDPTGQANACLIAAAPCLLAACKQALAICDLIGVGNYPVVLENSALRCALVLGDAIAKAEGKE